MLVYILTGDSLCLVQSSHSHCAGGGWPGVGCGEWDVPPSLAGAPAAQLTNPKIENRIDSRVIHEYLSGIHPV